YQQLLELMGGRELVRLICDFHRIDLRQLRYYRVDNRSGTIALLRALLLSGAGQVELAPLINAINRDEDWGQEAAHAVLLPFDAVSFERIDAHWQADLAYRAVVTVSNNWAGNLLPVVDWAMGQLQADPAKLAPRLRLAMADIALQRGDRALLQQAMHSLDGSGCAALQAAALIVDGQWESGQKAFEAALKRGQTEAGIRKQVFPDSIGWLYPLSLLAQGGPKQLELARKFCSGEAGKRTPSAHDDWGRWVNAIDARLGNTTLVPSAFSLQDSTYERYSLALFWKVMLAAWIGSDTLGKAVAPSKGSVLDELRRRLQACKFNMLLKMLDSAETVLAGGEPAADFFVASKGEQWREVLSALQELAGESA
ncbi:MAG: hypothetical protein Q8R95_11605, partial [Azonexus sp.]|nr:hypothetical protein [Azonexus sp.]